MRLARSLPSTHSASTRGPSQYFNSLFIDAEEFQTVHYFADIHLPQETDDSSCQLSWTPFSLLKENNPSVVSTTRDPSTVQTSKIRYVP